MRIHADAFRNLLVHTETPAASEKFYTLGELRQAYNPYTQLIS